MFTAAPARQILAAAGARRLPGELLPVEAISHGGGSSGSPPELHPAGADDTGTTSWCDLIVSLVLQTVIAG
jgi:hypothetical protein